MDAQPAAPGAAMPDAARGVKRVREEGAYSGDEGGLSPPSFEDHSGQVPMELGEDGAAAAAAAADTIAAAAAAVAAAAAAGAASPAARGTAPVAAAAAPRQPQAPPQSYRQPGHQRKPVPLAPAAAAITTTTLAGGKAPTPATEWKVGAAPERLGPATGQRPRPLSAAWMPCGSCTPALPHSRVSLVPGPPLAYLVAPHNPHDASRA